MNIPGEFYIYLESCTYIWRVVHISGEFYKYLKSSTYIWRVVHIICRVVHISGELYNVHISGELYIYPEKVCKPLLQIAKALIPNYISA